MDGEALKKHPIVEMYVSNNHFGVLLGMDFKLKGHGVVDYYMTIEKKP